VWWPERPKLKPNIEAMRPARPRVRCSPEQVWGEGHHQNMRGWARQVARRASLAMPSPFLPATMSRALVNPALAALFPWWVCCSGLGWPFSGDCPASSLSLQGPVRVEVVRCAA